MFKTKKPTETSESPTLNFWNTQHRELLQ